MNLQIKCYFFSADVGYLSLKSGIIISLMYLPLKNLQVPVGGGVLSLALLSLITPGNVI